MTSKIFLRLALILFIVGVFTATLAAQSVELYPYAGGFWPTGMDGMGNSKLKSEGIYGLKAGVFVTPNAEIEGSFGYINHFGMRNSPMDLTPNGIATPMGGFSSTAMGFLYDKWLIALILFSMILQLAALPVFWWGRTESKSSFK